MSDISIFLLQHYFFTQADKMENTWDDISLNNSNPYTEPQQWQNTIDILRTMQSDYKGTHNLLDKIARVLSEREYQINQCLQYSFASLRGFSNFCLDSYKVDALNNEIGKIRLGLPIPPTLPTKITCLEVRCLGRFEIYNGSERIERWQSVKSKEILQYLLTKPREPILKDTLIDILWPDCSIKAANNNLKAAVHGLRQSLSNLFQSNPVAPCVLNIQGSYLINPEIELQIDVEKFEKHFRLGRHFEKTGNIRQAVEEFEEAEALYGGDFLEDEPYEEWTLLRREALKDTYLFILSKLADHAILENDPENCILYCQKILGKDPCREDAYRRLICCYSRLGQRNRAIRWYEICRLTIEKELDSPPDTQTRTLYEQLLKGETL